MNQNVNVTALSASQKQTAITWLQQKVRNGCPSCGGRNMSIADDLVQPMPFSGGGFVLGGTAYPMFMTACGGCGNVQFYSAVMAGLITKP